MQTRRTVLQTVGTAGIAGVAGCSGDSSSDSGSDSTETDKDEEESSSGAWRSIDGNARNTSGNTAMAGPTSNPASAVLYGSEYDNTASVPIIENGRLYVVSEGKLVAVSTGGEKQWEFAAGDSLSYSTRNPAVRGGTVFLPTENSLVAIEDGERQWAVSVGNGPDSTPITTEQSVYVTSEETLFAYTLDGEKRWEQTTDEGMMRPAVSDSSLYHPTNPLTFGTGRLYQRDTEDGDSGWDVEQPGYPTIPVFADGSLYIKKDADDGTAVAAVSAEDGSISWESDPVSGQVRTPIVADGTVYLPSTEEVQAFDTADGSAVWDSPYVTTGTFSGQPRVDTNSVYLHQDGTIVAIDRERGEQRWSVTYKDDSVTGFSGFSLAGGSIYIAADQIHEIS